MPRLGIHPNPKKRFHGGRWRIYWKWNARQFTVATDHTDAKKTALVEVDLRLFSAALAMEHPEFPESYKDAPAVIAYLEARFPEMAAAKETPDAGIWLDDYTVEIQSECSEKWRRCRLNVCAN